MTDTGALGGRVVGIITTRDHEHVVRRLSSAPRTTAPGPIRAQAHGAPACAHCEAFPPIDCCGCNWRVCRFVSAPLSASLPALPGVPRGHQGDRSTTVASVMTSAVVTAPWDASPEAWEEALFQSKKGKLPLVDAAGKLCGVVSRADVRARRSAPPAGAPTVSASGARRSAWSRAPSSVHRSIQYSGI